MPTSISQYIFGNSLVSYAEGGAETHVPVWLDRLAEEAGNSYATSGGYGFLRNFADRAEPLDAWGYQGVEDSWDGDTESFGEAGFNSILITPANFIQYQGAEQSYWDEPRSPLDAVNDIVADVRADYPDAPVLIYEGWPDMGPFSGTIPPSASAEAAYYDYTLNDYHDWYVDLVAQVNDTDPSANVALIPVAPVLAELFTGTLAGIPAEDLYVDNAPHGTETVYFLASLITYSAIYGEPAPASFDVPSNIHPTVAANYPAIVQEIHTAVEEYQGDGGVTPPPPPPPVDVNDDPVAGDDVADVEVGSVVDISVLGNDFDPNGDPLTITGVSVAGRGSAEIVNGAIRYTAPDGGTSDVLTYTLSDGQGGTDTGTVQVTLSDPDPVGPAPLPPPPEPEDNEDPIVGDDVYVIRAGNTKRFNVLANDSDEDGDALTVISVSTPERGTAEIVKGQIQYTAPEGGGVDSFTYVVSDGNGGEVVGQVALSVRGEEGTPPPPPPEPVDPVDPVDPEAPATEGGYDVAYYVLPTETRGLGDVNFDLPPDATAQVDDLNFLDQTDPLWEGGPSDHFAARFTQEVTVDETGLFRFLLYADDGVRLSVDGDELVGHEQTGNSELIVGEVFLEAGTHQVEVDYYEQTGGQSLFLEWVAPDGTVLMDSLARPDGATLEALAEEALPEEKVEDEEVFA